MLVKHNKVIRINKFLALNGFGSRRKVEKLVLESRVKVNNNIIKDLATSIDTKRDIVCVDNKKVANERRYVYYMLNKPQKYISTTNDEMGRKTVLDLVKSDANIFPVGRLDYDTEGLILLTNDGDVADKLMRPKSKIPKTYIVHVNKRIKNSDLLKLEKGVIIFKGYKTSPAKVKLLSYSNNISIIRMVIYEGKNRQIKRMISAIGGSVIYLKRIQIGDIKLDKIDVGEFRTLNESEIGYLKNI